MSYPLKFFGETQDLSIFRHVFYAPLWYREWCSYAGEVRMFKRPYFGFAWNVGDSLSYKILDMHDNPKKHCKVLHRSVIYHVILIQHLKLRCHCILMTSTFWLSSRMMPSNVQGVENSYATPVLLPLGDPYSGKRMRVNAEGAQASDTTSLQKPERLRKWRKMEVILIWGLQKKQ